MGYFRNTDESPGKLLQLRREAYDLTVHNCGSELESLIFEHRLIKKYKPVFNTKVDICERKGTYTSLQDCIIILAHAEKNKCMSIWFRKNQKILMKPLSTDFRESENILGQLDAFFFQEKLSVSSTDFPEQEIVFRWIKRHRDSFPVIPVYRMKSSEEIYDSIKRCLKDFNTTVSGQLL